MGVSRVQGDRNLNCFSQVIKRKNSKAIAIQIAVAKVSKGISIQIALVK